MNDFDKTFPLVKNHMRKRAKSPGGGRHLSISPTTLPRLLLRSQARCKEQPRHYISHRAVSSRRLISSPPGGGKPRHYISHQAVSSRRLMSSSVFILLLGCLLVIFSGCSSLFSGVSGYSHQPTPVIKLTPTST